jgi:hypothetical protein
MPVSGNGLDIAGWSGKATLCCSTGGRLGNEEFELLLGSIYVDDFFRRRLHALASMLARRTQNLTS